MDYLKIFAMKQTQLLSIVFSLIMFTGITTGSAVAYADSDDDYDMDDLDDKGILTSLLDRFWKPIITKAKQKKENIIFLGEQGNWDSSPLPYFQSANMDVMFAFDLMFAIRNLEKHSILNAIQYWQGMPGDDHFFLFIENHDTDRIASDQEEDERKLRIAAILNALLPGIPMILVHNIS